MSDSSTALTVWIGVLGAAMAWFLWARRGRKPKFPECLKCGHNMTESTAGRCPECGRAVASPGELMRGRRRKWQMTAAALVFIVAAWQSFLLTPPHMWVPAVPTTVLIPLLRVGSDAERDYAIECELTERLIVRDGILAWSRAQALPEWQQTLVRGRLSLPRAPFQSASGVQQPHQILALMGPQIMGRAILANDAALQSQQSLLSLPIGPVGAPPLTTPPTEIGFGPQELFAKLSKSARDARVTSDPSRPNSFRADRTRLRGELQKLGVPIGSVLPGLTWVELKNLDGDVQQSDSVGVIAVTDESLCGVLLTVRRVDGRWLLQSAYRRWGIGVGLSAVGFGSSILCVESVKHGNALQRASEIEELHETYVESTTGLQILEVIRQAGAGTDRFQLAFESVVSSPLNDGEPLEVTCTMTCTPKDGGAPTRISYVVGYTRAWAGLGLAATSMRWISKPPPGAPFAGDVPLPPMLDGVIDGTAADDDIARFFGLD